MAEYVRDIKVTIEVDTNKRTITRSADLASIYNIVEFTQKAVDDIRDQLK